MPLVTENTRKNADKCMDCAMMRVKAIDEGSVLREIGQALDANVSLVMEGVVRVSCNSCPYSEDFKKVYGMMPYEYFQPGFNKANKKKKSIF
ncbi:MAG TPA: hypothetical protein PKY31_10575 [Spirochaetota bacterium]|mgnify:CR=1 FL=1|nr:hypothetical protein [Spirochaetota bacterium]